MELEAYVTALETRIAALEEKLKNFFLLQSTMAIFILLIVRWKTSIFRNRKISISIVLP